MDSFQFSHYNLEDYVVFQLHSSNIFTRSFYDIVAIHLDPFIPFIRPYSPPIDTVILNLAKQFTLFLNKLLNVLPGFITESPLLTRKSAYELLYTLYLCVDCFEVIAPMLEGNCYAAVHHRNAYISCLRRWNLYEEALSESIVSLVSVSRISKEQISLKVDEKKVQVNANEDCGNYLDLISGDGDYPKLSGTVSEVQIVCHEVDRESQKNDEANRLSPVAIHYRWHDKNDLSNYEPKAVLSHNLSNDKLSDHLYQTTQRVEIGDCMLFSITRTCEVSLTDVVPMVEDNGGNYKGNSTTPFKEEAADMDELGTVRVNFSVQSPSLNEHWANQSKSVELLNAGRVAETLSHSYDGFYLESLFRKSIDESCEDVNLRDIASMTMGFTGADLANLVNEAALLAGRNSKLVVEKIDFIQAVERSTKKTDKLMLAVADSVKGRKCTAYPAVKHALVAAGTHWVEPYNMDFCTSDGNLIIGATYEGHLEFIRLLVKALGGNISGSDKRILFLCGDFTSGKGMPDSARIKDSKILQDITTKQAEGKCFYAAICAAPAVILLPWGLLRGKQTTCHPAFIDKLSSFWDVKSNLQVSGELTTSRGPGTSFQFAVCLVEQLFGEPKAKEISEFLLLHVGTDDSKKKEFSEVSWSLDHTPQVLIPVASGCEDMYPTTFAHTIKFGKNSHPRFCLKVDQNRVWDAGGGSCPME